MEFGWTEDQEALHRRMQELGRDVASLAPGDRMAALAEGGALGLSISRDHGGGGEYLVSTAYGYEGLGSTLADGGLLLAAGAHLFGVAMTIQRVGNDAQRERFLADLATGKRLATVATTETGAGSDVAAVEATVKPAGDGFVASGDKRYVTLADRAGLFLFVARAHVRRGLTTAIVEACDGVKPGKPIDTIGLRGARLAPVTFTDCPITQEHILGREGAGMAVFQIAMTYERALVLAFRLGAMRRQLDEAVAFVRKRKVGGTSLSAYQAVTHRIALMKRRLESARLSTYRTAWLLDQGKRAQMDAALTKWLLADVAVQSALDAMRLRGGAGYSEAAGLGDVLDDALGGGIHSGTGDVLANIVAGWLGI
jgi:alkylation response protein AidB-like acyl-CoA dehydrogenase